jgi:anti-sigma regulatory factor (Ser/Thr protein kinase)
VLATDKARMLQENQTLGNRIKLELPAEPRVLYSVRETLRKWLAQRRLPDDTSYEITLACDEACTNAIEHARDPGLAHFEVTGVMTEHDIEIRVRDHGLWRAPREDDRGRGLGLMEALMDEVDVQPSAYGTTVLMRRRIPSVVRNAA